MAVIKGNSAIIPAPTASWSKNIQTTGDGTKVGTLYSIILTGQILPNKGSPQGGSLTGPSWGGPNNLFWTNSGYPPDEFVTLDHRLYSMETKQAALRALFAVDGEWLEFQSPDGSIPLKCQPRVKNISFDDGTWVIIGGYKIELECDLLYLNGLPEVDNPNLSELISSTTENWQIEDGDVAKTYRLTHTMSAIGKRQFDSLGNQVGLAWQNAKAFITNRLGLGYNTSTSFSPVAGNQIVASSFLGNTSAINFSALQAYDFVRSETVDEWDGSYSLTESWVLSPAASGTDVFGVSVRKFSDQPQTTTEVTIQGVIKGFYTTLNDYDARFEAAKYVWSQLQGSGLYNRAQGYAGGVTLNANAIVGSLDYNYNEGSISYNYEFTDRIASSGDVFEEYVISRAEDQSDYKTTITIEGRVIGRRYELDTNPDQKFNRALTYFQANLEPFPAMYNRVISSQYFPSITNLKQNPVNSKVDMDRPNGLVSYTYTFNTRENDNDLYNEDVHEEYNLETNFSRENGFNMYSVAGTIEGLSNTVGSGAREAKFNSALNYFNNIVSASAALARVLTMAISLSNTNPIEYEIQKNPTLGTIMYTYRYSSEPAPFASGALSEIISIANNNSRGNITVFAQVPVMGRTAGPVLQDMSTTSVKTKDITIETVFSSSNSFISPANYDSLLAQLKPNAGTVYTAGDQDTWIPRTGRYTRQVSWVYQ